MLLEVEDLRTWFPTPDGLVRAVDGVSFTLEKRRALGIVGESGSGKSVLVRSIMRLTPPTAYVPSGRILLEGRDLLSLSARHARDVWGAEVAMVFQDPMTSLNPVLKIGRQIAESLRFHRALSKKAAYQRAAELLYEVGLADPQESLSRYPHELSGGMRQRVGIAIALSCSPRLLIADEPTTALDVTVQRQILDLFSRLRTETEMGIILITHDLGVVAGRTDDLAVMYAGRIVELGPTRSIFNTVRHPYTLSLLQSIPRVDAPGHLRLSSIAGRPAQKTSGCRFAPSCPFAQPRCIVETPRLEEATSSSHLAACFYPPGTSAGEAALASNRRAGHTAADLVVDATLAPAQ